MITHECSETCRYSENPPHIYTNYGKVPLNRLVKTMDQDAEFLRHFTSIPNDFIYSYFKDIILYSFPELPANIHNSLRDLLVKYYE